MKSYIIKCKRTHWVISFELPELVLFQKQFNTINGFDKLFTDYYEFIDDLSINTNTLGNKPKEEIKQHGLITEYPIIEEPFESIEPFEIFILDI